VSPMPNLRHNPDFRQGHDFSRASREPKSVRLQPLRDQFHSRDKNRYRPVKKNFATTEKYRLLPFPDIFSGAQLNHAFGPLG
jgi:hypothetical protein